MNDSKSRPSENADSDADDRSAEQSISDSHAILFRMKEGDDSAFGKLAETLRPYLKQVVRNEMKGGLKGKVDESDVIQQTLVRAVTNVEGFRGTTLAEWRGWLAQIAKNEVRNAWRFWKQECRDPQREDSPQSSRGSIAGGDQSPVEIAVERERTGDLMNAVSKLNAEQQQLVQWRHFDGLSHPEIAQRLEITPEAVRQRWSKTLQDLRKSCNNSSHG